MNQRAVAYGVSRRGRTVRATSAAEPRYGGCPMRIRRVLRLAVAGCLAAGVALLAPPASAITAVAWQPHKVPLPGDAKTHPSYAGLNSVSCAHNQCAAAG